MVYAKSVGLALSDPRAYEWKGICADDCFGRIMTLRG